MIPLLLRTAASGAALTAVTLVAASLGAAPAVADAPAASSWLGSDFNNTGIGDRGTSNANLDGGGGFFIRDLLPAAGLPSGAPLTLPGDTSLGFVLGGAESAQPDNVVGTGQTLNSSVALGSSAAKPATKIAFVGAGTTSTRSNEPITLVYSDQTQQTINLTLTDWCSGSGADGNVRFGAVTDRWYAGKDDTGTQCGLWSTVTYALPTGKELDGIVLPVDSRLHIFAVASDAIGGDATLAASSAPSVAPAGASSAATSVHYADGAIALATDAEWAVSGVSTGYQWAVDGLPVANATSRAYVPRLGDVGKTVTVVATGRKSGYGAPGVSVSNGVKVLPGELAVAARPDIVGTPEVGSVLTVAPGSYAPSDADEAYQWLANGVDIAGATNDTFTPGAELVGSVLSVHTSVTRAGYVPLTLEMTAAAAVAALPPVTTPGGDQTPPPVVLQVQAASVPTIAGRARVGSLLTAKAPTFTPTDVAAHYQWLRAGMPIAGDTGATHRLVAADRGHAISVMVSGEKAGYVTAIVTSRATAKTAYGVITVTKKSTVRGTVRVGHKLVVASPKTSVSGTHTTVRWLRSGKAIAHATSTSYRLVAADRGKKITARLTVTKSGYTTVKTTVSTKKVK